MKLIIQLIFFHIYDNIAYIKHKDSCFSKDNLEIHVASKDSFEMNALKCLENNPFCMFNSRKGIPSLVLSCTPINVFNRIIKTPFYSFYKSIAFPSFLNTRAFILSHFLWNHSLQAAQVAMNRPLSMSGSELKKGMR